MRCRTVLLMAMAVMLSWSMVASAQIRTAAERTRSVNNLKQIGLAFHNYNDATGSLPRDITDKDGKPLLSWRVAILPYLEQQNLYQQFKLDEPWDSTNNKKLLETVVKVYSMPGGKVEKNQTYYQSFAGPGAFMNGKPVTFASITDGTSNTFMVIEAGETVPWTKPADIAFDPKKPLPALGGLFGGSFNVAFADGSVKFVRKGVKEETLKNFITIAGGEVVDAKDLEQ